MPQRELDHFANSPELRLEPTDILIGNPPCHLVLVRLADCELGVGYNQDRALWACAMHLKVGPSASEQSRPHTISFEDRNTVEQTADIVEITIRGNDVNRREDYAIGRPTD